MAEAHDGNEPSRELDEGDREKAIAISEHAAPVVFEAIRMAGENELARPASSLFWSGVAAGFSISLSVLCKGFFEAALPRAEWTPAISNLGYAVGFLVVILGRMQLFTENTITPILPLLYAATLDKLARTGRLWAIVFVANMIGCALAALVIVRFGVLPEPQVESVLDIARHHARVAPLENLLHGAPAGFMIAALVWMLPSAEGAGKFFTILLMTYMIGFGGLSHVVAGATEYFILAWRGDMSVGQAALGGILPTLAGNVVGGTFLFAALAYGQVKEEV